MIFSLYLTLAVMAFVPYLRVFNSALVYDDIGFLKNNPDLMKLTQLKDIFYFHPQPTRPLRDLFLAFGHYLSPDKVWGYRLLSVLVHTGVVLLLYYNLRLLNKRLRTELPNYLFFGITSLFALHPVLSETMAISSFLGDPLGTFFALLATAILQIETPGRKRLFGFFICLGLGALSKETFLFFTPLIALLIHYLPKRSHVFPVKSQIWFQVGMMCIFWLLILASLLKFPAASYGTYENALGWDKFPFSYHLRTACVALIEGVWKLVTGAGLTTIRAADRLGLIEFQSYLACLSILLAGFGILFLISYKGKWNRLWCAFLGLGWFVYLFVPNTNMGSERYLYFPAIGACGLIASAIFYGLKTLSPRPAPFFLLAIGVYLAYFFLAIQNRLLDYRTENDFHFAEIQAHPESYPHWAELIRNLCKQKDWIRALSLVHKGQSLFPNSKEFKDIEIAFYHWKQEDSVEPFDTKPEDIN